MRKLLAKEPKEGFEMINNHINDEIKFEEDLLEHYRKLTKYKRRHTILSQKNKGTLQFLTRAVSDGRRVFLRRGDPRLEEYYKAAYAQKAIEVLEGNIKLLRNTEEQILPYDWDSINEMLPKGFRDAHQFLTHIPPLIGERTYDSDGSETIQSENPYNRKELTYPVSNGLYVRSKNEAMIAEKLLEYDLGFFRYEKALDLKRWELNPYGEWIYYWETVYPDFTIPIDGGDLYWEHEGMMDDPKYRSDNVHKFDLYFQNKILIPDRLILTMDLLKEVPFDNVAVTKIIEDLILPRIDRRLIL